MKHASDLQAATNQVDSTVDTSLQRGGNPSAGWSLFEDDEDLFRPDLAERAGELINGQQQPPPSLDSADEENNDNASQQEQMIESSDNGGAASVVAPPDGGPRVAMRDQLQQQQHQDAYLDWVLQERGTGADRFMADQTGPQPPMPPMPPADRNHASVSTLTGNGNNEEHRDARKSKPTITNDRLAHHRHHPSNQVNSFLQPNPHGPITGAPVSANSKLAKLVHKIAPELSCYTGVGEYYHGSVAISQDQRPCLNWLNVRLALAGAVSSTSKPVANGTAPSSGDLAAPLATLARRLDNHNACRNPNSEPAGPWCFVAHSEQLDGAVVGPSTGHVAASMGFPSKLFTHKRLVVRAGANGQLFVSRPCAIASCSEYLWLYVVAPPLGLLVLLICLLSAAIRSIRKSHYNAIFTAAYQRHSNSSSNNNSSSSSRTHSPGPIARSLGRIFKSRGRRRCPVPGKLACAGAGAGKKAAAGANYLDDDVFEIVDDIDWSDGQTPTSANSMSSPKSSESFKLNAATFSAHHSGKSTLTHSKSINPMPSERAPDAAGAEPTPPARLLSNMNKSKSQAGPMFATLRCHVRNTQLQQQQRLATGTNSRAQPPKNSSPFMDSNDLATAPADWLNASITSNLSSLQADGSSATAKTGHLISCSSSSTNSNGNAFATSSNKPDSGDTVSKCILMRDLPLLDPTSVTIVHEKQPIYEGKFSQVQWAYLKQQDGDAAQATGRIGAQVAVCGLKPQTGMDGSVFFANNLRLRNLNHLNVLKLIGHVRHDEAELGQRQRSPATCALVYDMAHLMDLSDWLKEQSKEAVIAQTDEPAGDLSLRQNLTCLAKQVALAVDYLHDRQIVYKDLACRNCFLDVTRMLVKLASFNIEPELDDPNSCGEYDVPQASHQGAADELLTTTTKTRAAGATSDPPNDDINKQLNLKSMVRPKYLLDYYVIDSRPSECQLLPLSWIPLESILFNKFNRQTDIWSFGCLLYELFSLGEVAYFGYSSKQVIDSVRSNLMPPQPMLCPNGIYKLMCKCLSDIPTLRPNIKHIYEQLNLYSGQCSSFLNHHLCII